MCANETPPWIASRQACELRAHAARHVRQRRLDLVRRVASETTLPGSAGSRSQPAHVGQEHDLVRAQRPGDRAGRLVGVDVVRVALAVGADARDDRDVVLGDVVEHVDVDALDPAHEADVLAARRALAGGAEQQPVVAAQPDRGLAVAVDQQHDVLVDLADEHHLRDLDRLARRTRADRRRTRTGRSSRSM